MVLWCRQAVVNTAELRQRCCDQLRNTLRRGGREVWRRAARRRLPALQVDFTNATRKTSADVEVGLNQEFHDNTPEFQQNEMDALIERNVPIAEQAGTSSIRRQIRSQIVTTVDVEMENFRFIDDPDELAAEILNENVEKLAEPRISKLDGTWLKPTRAALLEERERQCSSDYNAKEAVYEGAQANYEEEKQKRENIEAQIEKIDKDGTNTEDEKKRRAQLEDDLAKAKESEKESEKMKNEAEDAKEKAKRDADKAEEEKKDDTSAEDFEKDLDKAFESGK